MASKERVNRGTDKVFKQLSLGKNEGVTKSNLILEKEKEKIN